MNFLNPFLNFHRYPEFSPDTHHRPKTIETLVSASVQSVWYTHWWFDSVTELVPPMVESLVSQWHWHYWNCFHWWCWTSFFILLLLFLSVGLLCEFYRVTQLVHSHNNHRQHHHINKTILICRGLYYKKSTSFSKTYMILIENILFGFDWITVCWPYPFTQCKLCTYYNSGRWLPVVFCGGSTIGGGVLTTGSWNHWFWGTCSSFGKASTLAKYDWTLYLSRTIVFKLSFSF